jgi:hypothetical protein
MADNIEKDREAIRQLNAGLSPEGLVKQLAYFYATVNFKRLSDMVKAGVANGKGKGFFFARFVSPEQATAELFSGQTLQYIYFKEIKLTKSLTKKIKSYKDYNTETEVVVMVAIDNPKKKDAKPEDDPGCTSCVAKANIEDLKNAGWKPPE